ncbi:phBC6A51 family helix-turn-helix protein [Lentilactobacillus buchneri]|uniref:phBC6A51 family helix-turn-helix protein n=1 Tax=Lentilactobacillus buchneri TaxID=1581 RepID=UPI0011EF1BDA|nr:phBC6A51 family helix-turn-helix protein [Lentilactobacillus buchneri]
MITKNQQRAIELMFEGNLSQNEISAQIKIHPTTLSRWKRDKDFIEAMRKYTDETIARSTPKAMSTMLKLLNARSELVRYNAAKDLLDRAGFIPTQKQEVNASINPIQIVDDVPAKSDSDG